MTEFEINHRALQIAGVNVDAGKVRLFMEFKKLLSEKGMDITIGEIEQVGKSVQQQIMREQQTVQAGAIDIDEKVKGILASSKGGEA